MKITLEVTKRKALLSGLVVGIALLLSVPFTVSASSPPQPLPEGIHCGLALQQINSINLELSGGLKNFTATVQAASFNSSVLMKNETYDSSTGHFYLQEMKVSVTNTTANKLVLTADVKSVLLDTRSNSSYVMLTFSIASASWKADPAFMQRYFATLPLTSASLNDFTVTLGVNCSTSTYTIAGSQRTNGLSLAEAYLRGKSL